MTTSYPLLRALVLAAIGALCLWLFFATAAWTRWAYLVIALGWFLVAIWFLKVAVAQRRP